MDKIEIAREINRLTKQLRDHMETHAVFTIQEEKRLEAALLDLKVDLIKAIKSSRG